MFVGLKIHSFQILGRKRKDTIKKVPELWKRIIAVAWGVSHHQ